MNRLNNYSGRRGFIFGIAALSLWIALFCVPNPAHAQVTVPVMVNYFDTGNFGSNSPDGITHIPSTCNFAIVDDAADQVFIVNPSGILQDQFDISANSNAASGIAYISAGSLAENFAITDDSADEVFIFNSLGNLQYQFDTVGFGSSNPQGITYITSGVFADHFAIVDSTNDTVFIVDSTGSLQDSFSTAGAGSSNPQGITFVPSSGFFAILDLNLTDVVIVNSSGIKQDQFDVGFVSITPLGIAYDSCTGNFAVVDDSSDEVFSINIDGEVFNTFSTFDFGSDNPTGITYIPTTGNYAIVDRTDDDVYVVSPAGVLQSQCDVSLFSTSPQGITYITGGSHAGNFAIVDNGEVFIIDSNCVLLDRFDTATFGINSSHSTGIDYIPATDNFEISDKNKDAVLVVDLSRPGRLQGQFGTVIIGSTSAEGISRISATDHTAIIDNGADEVFIVNSSGVLQARFDTGPFSTSAGGIAFDSDTNMIAIVDNNSDQVKILDLPSLVVPPDPPVCEGDFDEDGDVDGSDLAVFAADFGRTDCP